MHKYIDADLLISKELIPLTKRLDCCHPEQMEGVLKAMSKIDSAPAADVVEVVRCKDCRMAEEDVDGWCYCSHNELTHNPEHFCSYGERRKERGK
mgnify:CR=1 FL=1